MSLIQVSIIIPTYNRADIISDTLDCISAQTIANWECIVVDDGSEDGTEELLSNYIHNDPRFQYHKRPSSRIKGASSCRNIGLELAKGQFIQFLDSDDLISSNKLEEQLLVLKKNGPETVATCRWEYFSGTLNKKDIKSSKPTYKNYDNPLDLLNIFGQYKTFLPQHVYLINRSLIDKAGNWNEELSMNDDGEFFTRILLAASKIVFVPGAEVYYRIGIGNNLSTFSSEEKARSAISSWKLIDEAIENKFNVRKHIYVRQGITILLDRIRPVFPKLLEEEKDFFRFAYLGPWYARLNILSQFRVLFSSLKKRLIKL